MAHAAMRQLSSACLHFVASDRSHRLADARILCVHCPNQGDDGAVRLANAPLDGARDVPADVDDLLRCDKAVARGDATQALDTRAACLRADDQPCDLGTSAAVKSTGLARADAQKAIRDAFA
jgi:hypothetical protein